MDFIEQIGHSSQILDLQSRTVTLDQPSHGYSRCQQFQVSIELLKPEPVLGKKLLPFRSLDDPRLAKNLHEGGKGLLD